MFRDTNVTELTLPATMTAIGVGGWNNSSITTLFCEGSTPATIDAGWEGDATIMTAYVPDAAAVTAYGLADVWKDFAAILVVGNVGDTFSVADIDYRITSFGPNIEVEVAGSTLATPVIPSTVNNGGITYTVTAIGASAFKNNATITSIELPVTVTNIDNAAFQAAANLSAVTFTTTSGIRNIALRGFLQCASLTNVNEIISVLETIGGLGTNGNGTFNSCNITGTLTTPSTLTTSTATSIFRANHNMIVADLSASTLLTTLAGNFLFDNDGLTTVLLPPSLIELSASSVRDNPLLSSIIIPSTVTTYGTNVFKDNFAMLSVEVQNTAPVAIDASVFDSIDLSTATLTVPLGTTGDYDAAAVWTDFGTITDGATTLSTNNLEQELGFSIYPNPTSGVVSIKSKQLNNTKVSVYDLNGRALFSKSLNGTSSEINISNLASGVYLLKVQDENSEFVKRIVKQ